MAPRPPSSKMTQVARPVARYRKGQPLPGTSNASAYHNDEDDSDEDEDDLARPDENRKQSWDQDQLGKQGLKLMPTLDSASASGHGSGNTIQVAITGVEVDARGKVKVARRIPEQEEESGSSDDDDDEDEHGAAQPPTASTFGAPPAKQQESSSEYETDSETEEEELQARAPIYKPVFVSKRNRDTLATRDAALDPSFVEAQREQELQARKQQSHDLVAQSIVRELAQKEVQAVFPDVDDTDGLDPEAEFEAWKLRELMRIKRDKESRYAKEKEREQVEARRAMPEQLRLKEDLDYAKKTRDEKKKGSQVFGQKYHHKGAFYADAEILTKHDFTAPTVSTVKDMSSLPKAMQNKNFGKMSQSKYTHLADQDTSKEAKWGRGGGAGTGCFNCGGPHMRKDCPTTTIAGPSGANAAPSRDQGWSSHRGGKSGRRDDDRDGGRAEDRYAPRPRRDGDDRRGEGSSSRKGYEDRERERDIPRYDDRDRDRDQDYNRRDRDRDGYGGSNSNRRREGIGHSSSSSRNDRPSYDDARSKDTGNGRRNDKSDYDDRRTRDDRPRMRSQSPRGPDDKRRRLD
ncbi:hypothetical protein MVLG_07043 [Microbotryum lychnidis-dioicae p1A1 Lamole]|uniref:Micro-fibrillar-associated protein 1 C-terminal domain-containing protein n=1 Tax=Microbotryum lychnidis-dioicae (strain p1A1 Lamole / MvSl-1064) TaxID=683840 RepID=U5HJ54_USTV1|nr:hypothetical protein MVLG_07043 [Microbotryum lychnidis-dioicae p1A1 Lamole]|eukprot:KDE02392.1 hypothetical protein MVLG_07043 [Microbotryum lychnidis-dioicae p1A1 Lamole]